VAIVIPSGRPSRASVDTRRNHSRTCVLVISHGTDLLEEVLVDEIGPRGVVDLQVADTMGIQICDRRSVGGGDIVDQQIDVIAVVRDILPAQLQVIVDQDHIGSGNALLGPDTGVPISLRFQEVVGLDLGMRTVRVIADLPVDVAEFDVVDDAVALGVQVLGGESVELLEPVQVPPAASELAIGHHRQAVLDLLGDQIRDSRVLDLTKILQRDVSGLEPGSGILDLLRSQEGTDDVVSDVQHVRNGSPHPLTPCRLW
jgi:hypothetical protein